MKKYSIMTVTVMLFATSYNASAQAAVMPVCPPGYTCTAPVQYCDNSPSVPIEEILKGRQSVTKYLLHQVDSVWINYGGQSVVSRNKTSSYLDRNVLKNQGYVHDGQFTELANAISGSQFTAQVIKLPQGYYDVYCSLWFQTVDGKSALYGSGGLNIQRGTNGALTADGFHPYVSVSERIVWVTPTNITRAVYFGTNWRSGSQDLEIVWGKNQSIGVALYLSMIDSGYIVIADSSGNLTGWDLAAKTPIHGDRIATMLGKSTSGDVRSIENATAPSINAGDTQFYMSGDQIYGRFPLLDVTVTSTIRDFIGLNVPVYAAKAVVAPSHVYITPLYLRGASTNVVGQEYEVPVGDLGAINVFLSPGGYQIRTTFDGVKDIGGKG